MRAGVFVVVPWVGGEERLTFMERWGLTGKEPWLVLQRDTDREGCGVTKNKGVAAAVEAGADVVVVIDSDCYPDDDSTLSEHAEAHVRALAPQPVAMFDEVTSPPSRGTPYAALTLKMPVAASMGFWSQVGDYCAVRQLAHNAAPMTFRRTAVHGRYFPLCGMNVAFRPREWRPWCDFIDVQRFDDIWMGWLWQREAYRRGYCFNLAGPLVRHARQSDVWKNLKLEAEHLAASETLWAEIAAHPQGDYESLRRLLPVP